VEKIDTSLMAQTTAGILVGRLSRVKQWKKRKWFWVKGNDYLMSGTGEPSITSSPYVAERRTKES